MKGCRAPAEDAAKTPAHPFPGMLTLPNRAPLAAQYQVDHRQRPTSPIICTIDFYRKRGPQRV